MSIGSSNFGFQRSPSSIAALDGVRALAIVLVLCRHGVGPFVDEGGAPLSLFGMNFAVPLLNGWMGVDLFFVLSGFLIAGSLGRHSDAGRAPLKYRLYLAKRALRIVPAYYVVLLVSASGCVPFFEVAPERIGPRIAYHLIFFQDYLPSDFVGAFWSLGVEEKFYLTVPLAWIVLSGLRRRGRRTLEYCAVSLLIATGPALRLATYAVFSGSPSYGEFFRLFRSPFHLSLDPLYVGVLAALIYRDRERFAWTKKAWTTNVLFYSGLLVVGVLLFGGEMLSEPIGAFDVVAQPLLLAVGSGACVLALAMGGGPIRWFSSIKLFWISKLSYSLYLVHMLTIPMSLALLASSSSAEAQPTWIRFLLFLVPYLLLSLSMSLVLFYCVERPFLLWKEHLSGKWSMASARR